MKLSQTDSRGGFTLVEFMVVVAVMAILVVMLLPGLTAKRVQVNRTNCVNNLKQVSLAFRQWGLDNNDKLPMEVTATNGGAMEAVIAGDVATVFRVMSNELSTPKILFCREDKKRIQATTFSKAVPAGGREQGVYFSSNSNVSYFVGLDAVESSLKMFLTGDDNWLVGGEATSYGVAIKGVAVEPGVRSLWTNTPLAWSNERHKKQGNVGLADGSVLTFSSSKLAQALRNTGAATNRLVFP